MKDTTCKTCGGTGYITTTGYDERGYFWAQSAACLDCGHWLQAHLVRSYFPPPRQTRPRLSRIHWHDTATILHRAAAAGALAGQGATVSTENMGDTWRIQWGKA
jgi:hypothetical protein